MKSALGSFASPRYGAISALRNLAVACLIATPALAEPVTIAALGDSLTAGFGLANKDGLVPQLENWLHAHGHDVNVINAGVSGDTTAGGVSRLDWTLTPQVDAMIVELGANDMLRGLSPDEARANLERILKRARDEDLPVLLLGLPAPRNYGPDYKAAFDAIYPDLAAKYDTLLDTNFFAPLLKDGANLSSAAAYFQADGEHPNESGVKMIVDSLGPQVVDLLNRVPD